MEDLKIEARNRKTGRALENLADLDIPSAIGSLFGFNEQLIKSCSPFRATKARAKASSRSSVC